MSNKFEAFLIFLFLYAIGGIVVLTIMGVSGYNPVQVSTLASVTVLTLWPLFAVKYIIVGAVMLFHSAWVLLV